MAEYERLEQVYPALGYEVITLPKATVPERADFVLAALSDRGIDERLDVQKSRANGRFLPAHPIGWRGYECRLRVDLSGSMVAPRTAGIDRKRGVQAGQGEPPGGVERSR